MDVIGTAQETTVDFGGAEGEFSLELVKRGEQFADDALAITGRRVCDLVKGGSTLTQAAEQLGTTVRELAKNNTARNMLAALRAEYDLAPEDLKALVKVTATKEILTSLDPKVRLDAAKVIAAMPDVGLTPAYAKVNIAVGVFSDETKNVLATVTD